MMYSNTFFIAMVRLGFLYENERTMKKAEKCASADTFWTFKGLAQGTMGKV